jgi:hypothetical protein
VGGVTDVPQNDNDIHLQELARFAVDEHNKKAVRTTPPPPPGVIHPSLRRVKVRPTESVFRCLIARRSRL